MNRAEVAGVLREVRFRWTPAGEPAVIAQLWTGRPQLWADARQAPSEQPVPVRAVGPIAERIARAEGCRVRVEGVLRRRFSRRDGEPWWGQLELWATRMDILQGGDDERGTEADGSGA